MKRLNLVILVLIALFIDASLVSWNWQMGVIKSIPDAVEWFLAFFLVTFVAIIISGKIHAVRRKREQENVSIGQCMNCGGRLGYHHWTCQRHGGVFCSERCYYEHVRNTHRRRSE